MSLPLPVLYYGEDRALPPQTVLRAGPLSLVYEAGDLRYVRLGDQEILRRIYVAVRDHNWDTAPVIHSDVTTDIGLDHFHIGYTAINRLRDIEFVWRGEIVGSADGTLRFSMDGEARTTFRRNRIGFCVLHPMQCAGRPASIIHVDGTQEETTFPLTIAPQRVADGQIHPVYPFAEMQALAYEVSPGLWAEVHFEGDVFELEDQRNWTDASYKTYSTPLRLPFPAEVKEGTCIYQAVTLRLQGTMPEPVAVRETTPSIVVSHAPGRPLPHVGLGIASHDAALTAGETAALRALRLAHLRVDLDLAAPGYLERLHRAVSEAAALETHLEVALFLSDNGPAELVQFRAHLDALRPRVARWLVFHRQEATTPRQTIDLARTALGDYDRSAPIGGGTNIYFTELNRQRPDPSSLDFLCYSLNPQVHAFDNSSLVETLAAQAVTVASARSFAGDRPIVVSPVTLRPRFNPNATGPEPEPAPGVLPSQVDARQMSLFGAGWTLGSLKYLAESGVTAVTYYETTGWRGVIATAAGNPLPEKFQTSPGAVFPLYHVLYDMGEFVGGEVIPTIASEPLTVDGMTIQKEGKQRTLVANLGPAAQKVIVGGLAEDVTVRILDDITGETAMNAPDAYRAIPRESRTTTGGRLTLVLPPYAVATVDAA